jgi:hypothetical protein
LRGKADDTELAANAGERVKTITEDYEREIKEILAGPE